MLTAFGIRLSVAIRSIFLGYTMLVLSFMIERSNQVPEESVESPPAPGIKIFECVPRPRGPSQPDC